MSSKGQQNFSNNLTPKEKESVYRLFGEGCRSLCAVKASIYINENQWFKKYSGILCIIKDNIRRSYFCRMYRWTIKRMVWEQEIINDIKIEKVRPYMVEFQGSVSLKLF